MSEGEAMSEYDNGGWLEPNLTVENLPTAEQLRATTEKILLRINGRDYIASAVE